VPRARGQASRLLQEADGYNASVTQRADGDASRFRQILVEYAKAPAVTRQRLYLDMMQSVLGNSSKVLIDQKAGNNLLYLPLDQLLKQSAAGAAVAADAARPVPPETAVTVDPSRTRELSRGRDAGAGR
jgi:membrane protease subunit HflK